MAAHQALPSLGFSRQEHWSGLPFPSPIHESEKWKWNFSVMSDTSRPHGLQPTRLLCPWDFPGKGTGVGCHCLLHSFECMDFVGKIMSLLFNTLSRLVIAFFPRKKHFLISWLQSPSSVILKPKKIKSVTVSVFSPCICHEMMGPDAMIFVFWTLSFKQAFSLFHLQEAL